MYSCGRKQIELKMSHCRDIKNENDFLTVRTKLRPYWMRGTYRPMYFMRFRKAEPSKILIQLLLFYCNGEPLRRFQLIIHELKRSSFFLTLQLEVLRISAALGNIHRQ
jgi:hypothetical protein